MQDEAVQKEINMLLKDALAEGIKYAQLKQLAGSMSFEQLAENLPLFLFLRTEFLLPQLISISSAVLSIFLCAHLRHSSVEMSLERNLSMNMRRRNHTRV